MPPVGVKSTAPLEPPKQDTGEAVAAAAKGNIPLLVLGLLVSIPLIVFGATLLTKVMERFPIIITIGAALLGFLAGEMLLTDPAMTQQFGKISEQNVLFAGILGAVLVVILGTWLQKRSKIQDK